MKSDPIGKAIQDYINGVKNGEIIVASDLCDDDVIPVKHFFRNYDEMNLIEQKALSMCSGKILDVGAAAGCHSKYLLPNFDVTALEISSGAIAYLKSQKINCVQSEIQHFNSSKFDTLLLLMNGIGIAGTIENLPSFLLHLKSLLNESGKIICDSTDINYLYQNEDGSFDINLNANYYGEMQFSMSYQDHQTDWFNWLYVDYDNLASCCEKVGLNCKLILTDDYHYLAEMKL